MLGRYALRGEATKGIVDDLLFFVSKVCMAGDRGSLSSLFNWAGNTKSRRYGE